MKSISKLVAMAAVFATLVTSCIPEDEMNRNLGPAYLKLSQDALELTNKKVEASNTPVITIETNQSDIKVASLDPSWLKAEYREKGIYITAEENKSGAKRETSILVSAGSAREVVKVSQSTSGIILMVSPTQITLSSDGEAVLVDVRANGSNWGFEVEEGLDWLTVTRINDFLQVMAKPNASPKERTTQVYVRIGSKVTEVFFTQPAGNKGGKFALPMMERRATIHGIMAFEERQGNYLLDYTEGSLFNGVVMDASLGFAYESPIYSSVVYSVNPVNGIITNIIMTSFDPVALQSPEFMQYLADRGFSVSNNTKDPNGQVLSYSGSNIETAYGIDIKINKSSAVASTITLKSRGRQGVPYETFKVFPYDKSEYLMDGWTYAKIKANELAEGSRLDYETPSKSDATIIREAQFTVPEHKPLVARIIGMNETAKDPVTGKTLDKLDQLVAVFDEVTLGAFVADGKYYLTEEFQNLLTRSGFRYVKETDGLTQWYNDDKKILIIPRGTRFNSVLDLMPVLAISYFHRDLGGMTNAQRDAALSMMHDEVVRQDKLLGATR